MQNQDNKWTKEPNAEIVRVFRTTTVPFEKENSVIVTVNRKAGQIDGTTVDELFLSQKVNHAGQYVLRDNEQEYATQLKALRRAEKLGKVIEIDPSWEGKPFVPQPPPDAKDKLIEELKAKLEAAEKKTVAPVAPVSKGDK